MWKRRRGGLDSRSVGERLPFHFDVVTSLKYPNMGASVIQFLTHPTTR
jgi:hypothetical protein